MDINEIRLYAHVAAASLFAALAIVIWLVRGQTVVMRKALLASGAFAMASLWFWLLSATVKDHELFSRADLIPLLAVVEWAFVALGWAWFVYMAKTTFVIKRREDANEWLTSL